MKRALQFGARSAESRTGRGNSDASAPAAPRHGVASSRRRRTRAATATQAPSTGSGQAPVRWLSRAILPLTLVLLSSGHAPGYAETNASARFSSPHLDLAAFQVIAEKNIFNPNRSARRDTSSAPREPERTVRTESLALLGTMSYEKGSFAFFDGTRSDFRKVCKPAETIAGFKIAAVAPTCVKLESTNGRTFELCVGMQMSKREEDDWVLHEPASLASSGAASSPSAPESDEVVKRLLQRREHEGGLPSVEPSSPLPAPESKPSASSVEGDEVVRRLLQKREQEFNK